MQRDEEFLNGMWQKIKVLENEGLEIERVLQRDKEIKKKRLFIFMFFAFVFTGVCAASLFISVDAALVIILFTILIIAAIKLEFRAMKTLMKVS